MTTSIANSELAKRVTSLADRARSLAVTDQDSYDRAAVELKGIVALRQEIIEHHADMKRRAHQAWQAVIAGERKLLDPVMDAEHIYKQRIGTYETEQKEIEARARARAEREAQLVAAQIREQEIEQAEAAGADPEEVAAICAEPLPVVVPEEPNVGFTRAQGISTAQNWKGECVSLPALVRAIADGKANVNLVMPNQTALTQLARATRGTLAIPGVRIFNEPAVRTRR